MGSHFLTLYAVPLNKLAAIVGSKDVTKLAALGIAEDAEDGPYIEQLIQGNYSRDPETLESEFGGPLVRALDALCKKTADAEVTLELYDDPEVTPELWNFIWSEWEPHDPLKLPLCSDGAPNVTYKDSNAAAVWLKQFEAVKKSGGYDMNNMDPDDLATLIQFLQDIVKQSSGVFAFIEY